MHREHGLVIRGHRTRGLIIKKDGPWTGLIGRRRCEAGYNGTGRRHMDWL